MKTDYFAEFRTHSENVGNAGNMVTAHEKSAATKDFPRDGCVTHKPDGRVTRETNSDPAELAEEPVTRVTQELNERVTGPEGEKPTQNLRQIGSVTHVTQVTRGNYDTRKNRAIAPDSRRPLIESAVRTKLEAIESEARRLGWPPELLWNAGYWDCPRGIAAILDPDDEIVEVTRDAIAILKCRRDLMRFRRHVA